MHIKRVTAILGVIAILAHLPPPAYSQVGQPDLDRFSTEADRPIREEAEERLKPPPRKPPEIEKEKPIEEEKELEFFVKKINLTGVESFSLDEFKPVIEEYENRKVDLEELKTLSKKIARRYLMKGIVAACFVPPQDIKEGVVTLQVVEARMGELDIGDHKYFDKDRIRYYWELKPGDILSYEGISRSLQFVNKNPDRRSKATLRAGKKPGTTDVSISVDTHYPIHTTFSIDREGNASTGYWRKGAGFKHNNFLGFDDTLLSGYLWGNHFWGVYAYHTLPITGFGTSLLYGFSYTKSNPKGNFRLLDVDAQSKNISFFAHQDLYEKDKYLGDLYLGMDAKDKTVKINTGVLNRDRLRILRGGGSFVYRDIDSVTYIKPQLSQGLDFLWARRRDPKSTRLAKNIFHKWTLGVQHKKNLPFKSQLSLALKSQFAFTRLASQEQVSLGGLKSVRGYRISEYLSDNAVQSNVELLFPSFFIPKELKIPYAAESLRENTTSLIFFDVGIGARRGRDKWTEKGLVKLASVGTGLRIRLFDQVLLRLEWGFPIGDKPNSGSSAGRLHFSLDFEDKIPREIERINKILKENYKN